MSRRKQIINVLAIDGGGIRGVIPAEVLIHVEKKLQSLTRSSIRLGDHFDLIVGTSTGAILTGLYTIPNEHKNAKYSTEEALGLYLNHGGEIFKKKWWRQILTLNGYLGFKYDDKAMMKYYKKYFGSHMIGDATTNVMFTSVDMDNRNLFLFKSYKRDKYQYTFVDSIRASSAAPSYFKPHKLHDIYDNELCLTDGGMAINNPSISAYIEARKLYPDAIINVLSLGTGKDEESYKYEKVKKWGKLSWLMPLIDVILGSTSEAVEYQSELLYQTDIEGTYLRINPDIKYADSTLDNASDENLQNLRKDGESIAEEMSKEIEEFLKASLGY
jgi:patatin-like phospholipase/acyl hydrolase